MADPDMPGATCLLCQPPEIVGTGLMEHLRLFHPDDHEAVTVPADDPAAPDPASGTPFAYPMMGERGLEPNGCVCDDCGYVFKPGDPYATRLEGIAGGIPVTIVVCVPCGAAPG